LDDVFTDSRCLSLQVVKVSRQLGVSIVFLGKAGQTDGYGGNSLCEPVWSPDGRTIAFSDPATGRLYRVSADGSGPRLALSDAATPVGWFRDGSRVIFQRRGETSGSDLWIISAAGGLPVPLLQTPFNEQDAHFSPDGRWVAYSSDESGRFEIYVQPYQGQGAKWLISSGGGVSPRWSLSGRELFYLAPGGRLMSCAVDLTNSRDTLRLGIPILLFQVPSADAAEFEVTPDGHFILFGQSP
jgi:Tol biopolymer transport system component